MTDVALVAVDRATADRLDAISLEIADEMKRTVRGMIRIGERLLEAKAAAPKHYLAWLAQERARGRFDLSDGSAENFTRMAKRLSGRIEKFVNTPSTIFVELSRKSTPEAAVDDVLERLEAGEVLTVDQAVAIIDHYKGTQYEDAQKFIEATAPGGLLTAGVLQSVTTIFEELKQTGAVEIGEGVSIPLANILKPRITEETYERMMRQEAYIAEKMEELRLKKAAKAALNGEPVHIVDRAAVSVAAATDSLDTPCGYITLRVPHYVARHVQALLDQDLLLTLVKETSNDKPK